MDQRSTEEYAKSWSLTRWDDQGLKGGNVQTDPEDRADIIIMLPEDGRIPSRPHTLVSSSSHSSLSVVGKHKTQIQMLSQ